jgi:hypothetical protein
VSIDRPGVEMATAKDREWRPRTLDDQVRVRSASSSRTRSFESHGRRSPKYSVCP